MTFSVLFVVFDTKDGSVLKITISFVDGRYRVTDAILYGIEFYLHAEMDFISKLVYFSTFHREFGTSRIRGYYTLFFYLKPG